MNSSSKSQLATILMLVATTASTTLAQTVSWSSMGCYSDSRSSRALQAAYQSSSSNTIESCQQWCYGQNYNLAGVEYGSECYCGNSIAPSSQSLSSSSCQMSCAGNSGEQCGGSNWAISVYKASTSSTPPPPPTSSSPWSSLGCFTDSSSNRALKAMQTTMTGTITVQSCQALCKANKYEVAGVEGNVCYCDNVIAFQSKPTTGCSTICAGNSQQTCGGVNKINLYQLLQSTNTCTQPLVRKEWRQLTLAQQQQFLKGINMMKQAGSKSGHSNLYEDFVAVHWDNVQYAHNVAAFLPWHRWYLKQFENTLQQLLNDNTFALPYWDWTIDAQAPERSPLMQSNSNSFGTQNVNSNGNCINDGAFKGWYTNEPDRNQCVNRGGQSIIGAFSSTESVVAFIENDGDYNSFLNDLEYGPHAVVHNNMGGYMGTMASPNDPLFFMHHTMVDKCWYEWQMRNWNVRTTTAYGGSNANGRNAKITDEMPPFNVPVSSGMNPNAANMCFTYTPGIGGQATLSRRSLFGGKGDYSDPLAFSGRVTTTKSDTYSDAAPFVLPQDYFTNSKDRSDMRRVRNPPPLSAMMLEMMRMNVTLARATEKKNAEINAMVNAKIRISNGDYHAKNCLGTILGVY